MSLHTPDPTQIPAAQPARAARRLCDPAAMPRQGRATLAGKNGQYPYACPLDQRFLEYDALTPRALKKSLEKGDGDILEWIERECEAQTHRAPEIVAWSN